MPAQSPIETSYPLNDFRKRFRTSLVAVLAIALLFGPCLSISGWAGLGSVHAHAAAASEHGHDMDIVSHGHDGTKHDSSQDDGAPLGCDEMCDGAAVQKPVKRLWSVAQVNAPAPEPSMAFGAVQIVLPALDRSILAPPRTPAAAQPGAGVAPYALTNRYRL